MLKWLALVVVAYVVLVFVGLHYALFFGQDPADPIARANADDFGSVIQHDLGLDSDDVVVDNDGGSIDVHQESPQPPQQPQRPQRSSDLPDEEPHVDKNGIPIVRGQAELRGPFGPDALHGKLGLKPDGSAGWQPTQRPTHRARPEDLKNNGFFRCDRRKLLCPNPLVTIRIARKSP